MQSRYYALGSDIARVQQAQRYRHERIAEIQTAQAAIERQAEQARQLLEHDRFELEQAEAEHLTLEPQHELLSAEAESMTEQLLMAEQQLADWQQEWDQFNTRSQAPRQRAEVEQARMQPMEQSLRRHQERLARLEQEQSALNAGPLEQELADLQEQSAEQAMAVEASESQLLIASEALQGNRQRLSELGVEIDQQRQQLQILTYRLKQKNLLILLVE